MLLRFEVSNHRSIMDSAELSMIAVDEDRAATRGFDRLNERVLTVAGIYGANASGKSNVVDAIAWLSDAVGQSLRSWDELIPREPFKFAPGPGTPSVFEIEMEVLGVRHAYRCELSETEVLYEGLFSYPERRRRILFEREHLDVTFRRGLGGLAGTRELLTPTTLALSAAARFDDAEIRDFGRAVGGIGLLGAERILPSRGLAAVRPSGLSETARMFDERVGVGRHFRALALTLLQYADLGIHDVQVVEDDPRRQLRFIHRVGDQLLPFDINEESEGTRTWFGLIGPCLDALRNGRMLLFDEIDASLHPRLSAKLLELFQDPVTNPRGAQLVFTSHDTSLLNHLNRDEVWLTEKLPNGSTTLTALAEFGGDKVRRSLNLEKAYLQGRFGAVPEFDQTTLRRALGVAVSDA